MRRVIQVILLVVMVFLGYFIYVGVQRPIKFNEEKDKRYRKTIEKLMLIRDAQLAYKSVKGKYYKRLYNGEDKAVTLILEVNPDGKFSQQFLFSEQEHKTAILPNTLLQFRPSLFFFVGATVGNQTFGRIELKRGSDLR